jgi:uncharacterized repeat protein (TIGR03803 family)
VGSDGSFYGTTIYGGISNCGTIFKLTTHQVLTTLASFSYTNGANPYAGLLIAGNAILYGATTRGGAWGYGTVFRATTNGSITVVASLDYMNGAYPYGALILARDGTLYGTAMNGGSRGGGSVFRLNVASHIQSIGFTGTNVQIRFTGFPNTAYHAIRTADLLNAWTTVGAVTTDQLGGGAFTDTSMLQGGAFYRIVEP